MTSTADWLPDGFSVQRIHTNDTHLSVAVGGDGPVLVLLHGWPQTSRAWARVMPDLAERHTVVVPDLRGAGDSDRPEGGYAKTDQADDIRGILTALNLSGPVGVAGHDIGAMVAFAWAAARPEDISHLVLIDALLPGLGLEEAMNVAEGGMWHFGFFMTEHLPEMLFDGHEREFIAATFTAMSNPGTFTEEDLTTYARAYTGRDRLRGGFAHYRTLLDDGRENRALLARRRLPMPVLAIGSTHSGTATAQALTPHADDVQGVVAPTGHFVAEEDPDWFTKTVTTFLASGARAPGPSGRS
ncbi:alpha/beta fold hydrolase [Streptomyces sp. Amel2xC10]|uniref:alpha/beta fold hydrolase n=1 Tax=Streptomyces sp. Amel2xC10 TaxID=1305826 RepID=UPI000A0898EF|nr:alpha/beta hydrolase [Streptomyces sp. Amel2xC10]SME87832.1 Pimeloyl-ACP methyl ester carboxylesterase [Streptomyces sp. Amel2xC10]